MHIVSGVWAEVDTTDSKSGGHGAGDLLSKKFRKELSSGTSALILLGILSKAEEPLYGYQISKLLERDSSDKQGAIYPVLRNMVAKGLLEVEVMPSDSGPPRKYFSISPLGRSVLEDWSVIWEHTKKLVDRAVSSETSMDGQGHE